MRIKRRTKSVGYDEMLPARATRSTTAALAKAVKAAPTAGVKRKSATGAKASSALQREVEAANKPAKQKKSNRVESEVDLPISPNVAPAGLSSSRSLGAVPSLLPTILPFDLSTAFTHLASHDARFHHMSIQIPCKPFQPPFTPVEPFRTLVTSIIGQQVSWMAARAINNRFKALYGFSEENNDGFPTPKQIAETDVLTLKSAGLSMRKAEYGEFSGLVQCQTPH
jgi:DNA-3-methyladenine glycosylase II